MIISQFYVLFERIFVTLQANSLTMSKMNKAIALLMVLAAVLLVACEQPHTKRPLASSRTPNV